MNRFFRCALLLVLVLLFVSSLAYGIDDQASSDSGFEPSSSTLYDPAGDMQTLSPFSEQSGTRSGGMDQSGMRFGATDQSGLRSGQGDQSGLRPGFAAGDQSGLRNGQFNQFGLRSGMGDQVGGKTGPNGQTDGKIDMLQQPKELRQPGGKKVALQLTVEPGDSLISLHWLISGLPPQAEQIPIRYTIFYGTQSQEYSKKIEVGRVTTYKLRDLKNRQPYYILVRGYNRENELVFFSKEQTATPLAEEDLGSSLEKAFGEKTLTLHDKLEYEGVSRKLTQFGYEFFKNSTATLTALDNIPVGDDYRIGAGDTIKLDLWGGISGHFELPVDRSGEITIPGVGTVNVWGLPYGQLHNVVNRAVSRYYRHFELSVTLGRLRTIQVYLVGEVANPGTYTMSSLSTVVNALSQAGGPSKTGSLRNIRLLRDGKVVQQVDLYDVFLSGDRSKDVRFQNGDTIFVPVIGPVVAVAGEVKRPAIYETKGGTSLKKILEMAGGITSAGDTSRISVERIEEHKSRVIVDYDNTDGKLMDHLNAFELQDRDLVKIFPVAQPVRHTVGLAGNVLKPGQYHFTPGMHLKDLIPDYSVLKPGSYTDLIKITRLAQPDLHTEILSVNLRMALAGDAGENIALQDQDEVRVFPRKEMQQVPIVSVAGQVVRPDDYEWFPNMTVRDLVTAAGSLKRSAYLQNAEVKQLVVDGGHAKSVYRVINLAKALTGDPANNLVLSPNDALNVRSIEDWTEAADSFVQLKGEVRYPGFYAVSKGERLSSVIARAGGFTDKAYLTGSKFTRKSVQREQQKRMDEVISRTEQEITKKQAELPTLASSPEQLAATRAALDALQQNVERLKTLKAEGRVVIRLQQLAELEKTPYDLELRGGDVLDVPMRSDIVNVMGQVYNPTSFVLLPNKDVKDYLDQAGGPTNDASPDEIYVIRADGTVVSRLQSSFSLFHWGGFMGMKLDSGDTVVVPQNLDHVAWIQTIKDITTIVSQVALTAGTVLIGLK